MCPVAQALNYQVCDVVIIGGLYEKKMVGGNVKKLNRAIIVALLMGVFILSGLVMAADTKNSSLKRVVLKVENLSCGGCFAIISEALTPLEGYSGMGTNLWRKLIGVDFGAPLTSDQIVKTISDLGYPATIQSVDPVSQEESFAQLEVLRGSGSGCGGGSGTCGAGAVKTGGLPQTEKRPVKGAGSSCCSVPGASQI